MSFTIYSTAEYDAMLEPIVEGLDEATRDAFDDAEGALRDALAERPTLGLHLEGALYQTQLHLPGLELSVFIAVSKARAEAFLIAVYDAAELRSPDAEALEALRAEAAELA